MELLEIHEKLETLPELKASGCERAAAKKFEWENAKLSFKREEAIKRLAFRRTFEDDTVGDTEARLLSDDDLSARRREIARLENQYEVEMYKVESYNDQLNAVKLIGRLKMAEMGAGLEHGRD